MVAKIVSFLTVIPFLIRQNSLPITEISFEKVGTKTNFVAVVKTTKSKCCYAQQIKQMLLRPTNKANAVTPNK